MANRQTILVVEDEKTIGNYIETILLSNEYKVLRAMNGTTGLSLCTSHHPEVILFGFGASGYRRDGGSAAHPGLFQSAHYRDLGPHPGEGEGGSP